MHSSCVWVQEIRGADRALASSMCDVATVAAHDTLGRQICVAYTVQLYCERRAAGRDVRVAVGAGGAPPPGEEAQRL